MWPPRECNHFCHFFTLYRALGQISSFWSLVDLELEGIAFGRTESDIALDLCDLTHLLSLTHVSISPASIEELFFESGLLAMNSSVDYRLWAARSSIK